MKNAAIIHGTGTRPDEFWFEYVKKALESKGCAVWLPQMPHSEKPNLKEWIPFVLDSMKFSEETILIGHSTGSQLILSVLERIDVRIKQAILVSGYAKALRSDAHLENDEDFNWDTIKEKCRAFVFINSDNDPWGCNDTQGRIMLDKLGGTLVIPKGEGHMGSTTYKQPYKEFPLLVKLLDL